MTLSTSAIVLTLYSRLREYLKDNASPSATIGATQARSNTCGNTHSVQVYTCMQLWIYLAAWQYSYTERWTKGQGSHLWNYGDRQCHLKKMQWHLLKFFKLIIKSIEKKNLIYLPLQSFLLSRKCQNFFFCSNIRYGDVYPIILLDQNEFGWNWISIYWFDIDNQ